MRKGQNINQKRERAARLRTIRKNARLTQEEFSEQIGISVSAYKKVETGENQLSIDCLSKIAQQMEVTSDYVLFGKKEKADEAWNLFMNCSERDKVFLFLRMFNYFTKIRGEKHVTQDMQVAYDEKLLEFLKEMTL